MTRPRPPPVALRTVRLVPGSEFFDAQQLNTDYLLSLSVARLLVSFYVTAGLAPPHEGKDGAAQPYGGWEDAEGGYPDPSTPTRTLRGHFVRTPPLPPQPLSPQPSLLTLLPPPRLHRPPSPSSARSTRATR